MNPEPLFCIDREACLCDGLCVAACPLGLVVQLEPGGVPEPLKDKGYRCIACGHCAAVCPSGAFGHKAMPGADFRPIRKDLAISADQAEQFLTSRRSVRNYQDRPVPRALLARAVGVSCWAPSGHNAHPVRWSVIESRQGVAAVAAAVAAWMAAEAEAGSPLAEALHLGGLARAFAGGRDLITRGAPHLATAWAPEHGVTPLADAHIAGAYVELAAFGLGLGACWCGYAMMAAAHSQAVRQALGAPDGHSAGACLLLGYPSLRYWRIPPRPGADITWLP